MCKVQKKWQIVYSELEQRNTSLELVSQKDFLQLVEVTVQGSTFVNQRRPTQNKDPAKIPARYG